MTDKEIIRALRICATHKDKGCGLCPQRKYVRCTERLADEAITMIERLTAERDALIEQIKERHDCMDCKHNDFCEFDGADGDIIFDCMNCMKEGCPCAGCIDSSRWEWRGLPEATEEGEKA